MDMEIVAILSLLHRKRIDCYETTECYYDRVSRQEYLKAENEGEKIDEIFKLMKELYPIEYKETLN